MYIKKKIATNLYKRRIQKIMKNKTQKLQDLNKSPELGNGFEIKRRREMDELEFSQEDLLRKRHPNGEPNEIQVVAEGSEILNEGDIDFEITSHIQSN